MRLFYSALYYCLLPLMLLRMLWRSRRAQAYRKRLPERFGLFPARLQLETPAIWVHAVSVGEVLAAVPLIESLLATYPATPVVVTTTTPTGSERVQETFGERVLHVYAPWDLPGAVQRFLQRMRPRLLLIMETELWPNMLHYCQASGCRTILVNARMSERSARGYRRLGGMTRRMMTQLDQVACQASADGERFLGLGLAADSLAVIGNLKFDLNLDNSLRRRAEKLRERFAAGTRPVLVAASTHPGEEALILSAYREIRRHQGDCLLVLVPRHPERFNEVHALCGKQGWQVRRRSSGIDPGSDDDILLGDTMGELLLLLGTATVAVFGGSFFGHGGHNVLEAAAWGVPVVTGPGMENFAEVSELLVAEGAMMQLLAPSELPGCLLTLLADAEARQHMSAAGTQVMAGNRGATDRLLALVACQLGSA